MLKNFIIAGSGGQGVISMGNALAAIIILKDLYVTLCSSYGAEMRGGAVNCEINMSDGEIFCTQNQYADYVVALNQSAYDSFISKVKANGTIIINSSLVDFKQTRDDIKYISIPFTQTASNLGNIKFANSMALGVLLKQLEIFTFDEVKEVFEKNLKNKKNLIEKNLEAYNLGFNYID